MKKLLIAVLFSLSTNITAMGWDTLNPKPEDDIYFFHGEGQVVYTMADNLPDRYSYFWTHLTGGYEVYDNFWLSLWISTYNHRPMVSTDYFKLNFFPQVSFTNLGESPVIGIEVNAGTIGNFTHGQGLFYSQFTGYGTHIFLQYSSVSLDFYYIGNGYWSGDDTKSLFFYPFKKYFGLGLLWEEDSFTGDRIIPGFNFELTLLNQIRFYGEYGIAFVNQQDWADPNINFNKEFTVNRDTAAGLMGIDWKFNFHKFLNLEGNLANQVRYYGREHSDFYSPLTLYSHDFNYLVDASIDQKYNNQPHNFYFDPGEKLGFYFRQEVKINPVDFFYFSVKNELLWIYPTGEAEGSYEPYTLDLLTLELFYQFAKKIDAGFRVSNVTISRFELSQLQFDSQAGKYLSEGIMLKPAEDWYFEIYSHFKF
jgi:hypothetical protein